MAEGVPCPLGCKLYRPHHPCPETELAQAQGPVVRIHCQVLVYKASLPALAFKAGVAEAAEAILCLQGWRACHLVRVRVPRVRVRQAKVRRVRVHRAGVRQEKLHRVTVTARPREALVPPREKG